ncbi:hypothetical protein FHG87_025349 [Trinorchestia longiramus]|nr:hypothetical protein FHG87_025349 [Trinorchestia longiramus]
MADFDMLIACFKDVPGDADVLFWQHIGAMNEPFKDEEPVTLQIGKYDYQVENEITYEENKTFLKKVKNGKQVFMM